MKRVFSTNELFLNSLLLLMAVVFISEFFNIPSLLWVIAIGDIILIIAFKVQKKYFGRKLPSKCKRNFNGLIEVHVEKDSEGRVDKLLRILVDTVIIAREENKDILIDTWLIKKDKVKKYFGNAAVFPPFGLTQKLSNRFYKWYYKPKRKSNIKPYRCIIKIGDLTDEQVHRIDSKVKKLEARFNRNEYHESGPLD